MFVFVYYFACVVVVAVSFACVVEFVLSFTRVVVFVVLAQTGKNLKPTKKQQEPIKSTRTYKNQHTPAKNLQTHIHLYK